MNREEEITKILNARPQRQEQNVNSKTTSKPVRRTLDVNKYSLSSENASPVEIAAKSAMFLLDKVLEIESNPESGKEEYEQLNAYRMNAAAINQSVNAYANAKRAELEEAEMLSGKKYELERERIALEQRKLDVESERNYIQDKMIKTRLLETLSNEQLNNPEVSALLESSVPPAQYKDRNGNYHTIEG